MSRVRQMSAMIEGLKNSEKTLLHMMRRTEELCLQSVAVTHADIAMVLDVVKVLHTNTVEIAQVLRELAEEAEVKELPRGIKSDPKAQQIENSDKFFKKLDVGEGKGV